MGSVTVLLFLPRLKVQSALVPILRFKFFKSNWKPKYQTCEKKLGRHVANKNENIMIIFQEMLSWSLGAPFIVFHVFGYFMLCLSVWNI